jgi:peptidoglycan hydrolase-like protein with peptidoglycan-binding domain
MKWFIVILLVVILAVPLISGVNYLRKNDLKIFGHSPKEGLREEELLGSDEVNNFRVAQIQNALKSFGYDPGVIDGRLGKNTRKAIKKFQIAKEILPTGKIDSRTYFELSENPKIETKGVQSEVLVKRQEGNLKNVIPTNATEENKKIEEPQEKTAQLEPLKVEQKSYASGIKAYPKIDIKSIQLALKKLGLYHSKIDGLLGKRTRLAIKKFQRSHDLKPDGILGHKTMLCLNKEVKR